MLEHKSIQILEHLVNGHGHKRIASILDIEQSEYLKIYCSILTTTKCWDDIELGAWWFENRHKHIAQNQENVASIIDI